MLSWLVITGRHASINFALFDDYRPNPDELYRGAVKRHLLADVVTSIGIATGVFLAVVTGRLVLDPLLAARETRA